MKGPFGEGEVYVNGKFVSNNEATISVFDAAFEHGDSVQEFTRTFRGSLFRLDDHLKRLFKSLKGIRIDPLLSVEEMKEISLEVLERNKKFLGTNDDGWVIQLISSGIEPRWWRADPALNKPTIVVFFQPIFFEKFAEFYEVGIHVITPSNRRVSPISIDPKMKQNSRMDLNLGTREIRSIDPNAKPLFLDQFGNIAEGDGQNIFLVSEGILKTPNKNNVLCGISRETVIDLAKEMGITVEETELQPYDLYNADEAFLTATSHCILPISKFNWAKIGDGKPGVITKKLLKKWSDLVGVDIVEQAISHIK